jgi:Zn-dependent protease
MRFSIDEIKELVISAVVIGFCFAWIVRHYPIFMQANFIEIFVIMLIAVGAAFIFHELAHKVVAQRYGCWAEYKMWETGLIFAFFLAVSVGIVFAAPGAVYISCGYYGISRRENGIISVAGPSTNLVLASIFLIISTMGFEFLRVLGAFGFFINAWLALFNVIPFPPLDGSKIKNWDTKIWAIVAIASFLFWKHSFSVMMNI